MKGSFYNNTMFNPEYEGNKNRINANATPEVPIEQSYIENILRANKGKKVSVYVSFSDSVNWRDKIFTGIIEQSGRDHIILKDSANGKHYMILMIYLDYVEFDDGVIYKK